MNRLRMCFFTLGLAFFLLAGQLPANQAGGTKNIVLIAGLKSHGPEGNGIHDYAWSVRLLKTMLENSNVRDQVTVRMYLNAWPGDSDSLAEADTIVILSDGRDGDSGREAPHLATAARVELVDSLMQRGCGIAVIHFSTFAPDRLAEKVLDWYGGYFDWETDGRRDWYSDIETMQAGVQPASAGHPVLNGVESFEMREEFYYDIRFRPDDTRWTPIWEVESLAATRPRGQVVSWAVQRDSGGRGFATTCGHFYENWQQESFRKTILNAIVWTAQVKVPAQGVVSQFYTHQSIAAHLREPDLVAADVEAGVPEVYTNEPYWYQPGHPVDPAQEAAIQTLPGFQAQRILAVPGQFGSWTALTVDDQGRLIAAAQHEPGLYRVTPPRIGDPQAETKVERLQGVAETMGWSHGLLHAMGSLYVTVSEGNDQTPGGVYRLQDTDGDDQFDEVQQVLALRASGEHGPHNLIVGPDGETLYFICGNGTPLPESVGRRRPVSTTGIDHLMPPGFGSSRHSYEGWVCRFDPDGGNLELVSAGLRNSFDLAFNQQGDLFTFDSDMEWDLGAPWYRPTRICQLVSGGEFGWRADGATWPEYYEDSTPPVVNIGPASPTGVAFGYGARFPPQYQRALFACDWTFAAIHAIHIEPHGAGYRAEVEEFVGGSGLPVTDLVVGRDGAMYFIVGGRRLGSALYRVYYSGEEPVESAAPPALPAGSRQLHALRRSLEAFHGVQDPQAVAEAWPHLGHRDRWIRFAARVAIETQPVATWRTRAVAERDLDRRLTALLALARQDSATALQVVIQNVNQIDLRALSSDQQLRALRIYQLAIARGADSILDQHSSVREKLRACLPSPDSSVNRELSRLLCYLEDPLVIDPLLAIMQADSGERPLLGSGNFVRNPKYGEAVRDILESAPLLDRMHHAQMLLWVREGWTPEQRERYFALIADARKHTKGGYWYDEFWQRIREAALEGVAEADRDRLAAISAGPAAETEALPQPVGPGRKWTLEEALNSVEGGLRNRDFENGRRMYEAATCGTCHRFNGHGSSVGPDLSSLGQRFTLRDMLDSTLHPSKAVSDQYRVTMVVTVDGRTYSGRVVSQDGGTIRLATNLRRPNQSTAIDADNVDLMQPVPVSTMPTGLLDSLNEDELLDLLAYLVSSGDHNHPVFTD